MPELPGVERKNHGFHRNSWATGYHFTDVFFQTGPARHLQMVRPQAAHKLPLHGFLGVSSFKFFGFLGPLTRQPRTDADSYSSPTLGADRYKSQALRHQTTDSLGFCTTMATFRRTKFYRKTLADLSVRRAFATSIKSHTTDSSGFFAAIHWHMELISRILPRAGRADADPSNHFCSLQTGWDFFAVCGRLGTDRLPGNVQCGCVHSVRPDGLPRRAALAHRLGWEAFPRWTFGRARSAGTPIAFQATCRVVINSTPRCDLTGTWSCKSSHGSLPSTIFGGHHSDQALRLMAHRDGYVLNLF